MWSLATASGHSYLKGVMMCQGSSSAMTWQDVYTIVRALEEHTGGSLDLLLTPTSAGLWGGFTVSVYLNIPKLQGVGRSLCLLADGRWPGGDFKTVEALAYYLVHQVDVEYQRMHTQATLDNLAW